MIQHLVDQDPCMIYCLEDLAMLKFKGCQIGTMTDLLYTYIAIYVDVIYRSYCIWL